MEVARCLAVSLKIVPLRTSALCQFSPDQEFYGGFEGSNIAIYTLKQFRLASDVNSRNVCRQRSRVIQGPVLVIRRSWS